MLLGALICVPLARAQSAASATPASQNPLPSWAYPLIPPGSPINDPNEATDHTLHSVPDGAMALTMSQVHNRYKAPDWHPDGHPAMPTVVALGREPQVFACGYCHLPNGQGRPENSSLAGLPAGYIVEQLGEFRSGQRRSSEPRQQPIVTMSTVETQADAAEVQAAADYFASLKPRRWIKVVESATVPKTRVLGWMLVPISERETEPTGDRIIEVPQDTEQTELRNDASGFIAYVPPGSIQRGAALVTTGGAGTTIACGICHGPELRGLGNVPSIAGRSPSYIVRQLYDIQSGARHGLSVSLMQAVVAKLSVDDMVAIAAYTSSRDP